MNSEHKLRKNLRSKKGCSKLPNIFLQDTFKYRIPPPIFNRIQSFNALDCESINRLTFYAGGCHEDNKIEMQKALICLEDKKLDDRQIEGYRCSEFTPRSGKGERSIKEDDRQLYDELLENSQFRKDLDGFILH